MLQAMFSGVSGLQVHQTKLDVIGNNIANVNTIGFKAGRVTFEDQLSQTLRSSASPGGNTGGQNPAQVGLGVLLGTVDTLQTQGNLQTTGKATDMAIQGNGFFMVGNGTNVSYTRDGTFDLDSDGKLVNPATGNTLLGYVADANGNVDATQQVTAASLIKIPVGTLTSVKESSSATFQGNLAANSSLQTTHVGLNGILDISQQPATINGTVYDALGNAHTLQVALTSPVHNPPAGPGVPAGATQSWSVNLTLDGATTTQTLYAVGGKFVFTDATSGSILGSTVLMNGIGASGAPNFSFNLDFGKLSDSSSVTGSSDGQKLPTPVASTIMTATGNLNADAAAPPSFSSTVFDSTGSPNSLKTSFTFNTFYNPPSTGGAGVPVGATASYDVQILNTTKGTSLYDSAANPTESKAYFIPGQGFVLANATTSKVIGSQIQLTNAPGTFGPDNAGAQVVAGLPLTVDLGKLTSSSVTEANDGQTGTAPTWNTSLQLYDSLGVGHLLNFKFSRALVGAGAPSSASARWEWSATEGGVKVADSLTSGNSALFFDNIGNVINTKTQSISITPNSGAKSFNVAINFGTLTQLSGASSVAATTQDGFPVGTLQTFSISQDGIATGIFSNGQTRVLGQIATATFSNPAGLEKQGTNLYKSSNNSGLPQVGLPNQSGRGKINTGFVEMSNVDLSTEFTNLIVTQRGFQANTRIITVVDQLLQEVVGLIR